MPATRTRPGTDRIVVGRQRSRFDPHPPKRGAWIVALPQDRLPFDLDLRFPQTDPAGTRLTPVFERATSALLRRVLEEFEPDWAPQHGARGSPEPLPASARWVHEAAWTVAGWPTHIEPAGPLHLTPAVLLPSLHCPEGRYVPLRFVDLGSADPSRPGFAEVLRAQDAAAWTHHLRVGHIAGVRPHPWEARIGHPLEAGRSVPACLVDLTLFAAEHARALIALERPALVLLPDPVDARRARLWHDLLTFLEDQTGIAYAELRVILPIPHDDDERALDATLFELRDRLCAVLDVPMPVEPATTPSDGRVARLLARRAARRLSFAASGFAGTP